MHVLVPLVVALIPLVITPGLLSYFDITPKIAILLLGLSLSLLYPSARISDFRALMASRAGRWFTTLILATWVWDAVATAASLEPLLSLNGGAWRRYGFIVESGLLLFVLLSAAWLAEDKNNARLLLRACCTSGALAALYGIAQYFGWDPWLPSKAYQAGEGIFTIIRPPGTLGHADYFAAWMLMVAFLALALQRLEPARWSRIAALSVSVLAMIAIILSGARSGLLGLLVGGIVLATLTRPRVRGRVVVLMGIGVAGLTLFFFSPAGAMLRARVHWSAEDVWGGARLLLWRDSLLMALQRPVTGFGPEIFTTEFPRFESKDLARAYPDFYHESPHNIFLDALTTRGVIGLLLLLALCGLAIYGARWTAQPAVAAGFAAALVSQQFMALVVATALYFFLLIALLVVKPSHIENENRGHRWVVPLSVAASLFFAGFTVRLLVADRALARAYAHIEAGDAASAARDYSETLRWHPAPVVSDLNYSRAMIQLASRTRIFATRLEAGQQALAAAVGATRSAEDRQNAWYNLAELLALQNDRAGVERALQNAIAWAPNWFKPHWALAQLLERTGHPKEAMDEARLAYELDGGRDAEVTETWKRLKEASDPQP